MKQITPPEIIITIGLRLHLPLTRAKINLTDAEDIITPVIIAISDTSIQMTLQRYLEYLELHKHLNCSISAHKPEASTE